MATQTPKVLVQIDNETIELTGVDATNFNADREAVRLAKAAEESARASTKTALLERLGITADEAALLLS
jgi:hypothetical protein